jgi:hypothetical protein
MRLYPPGQSEKGGRPDCHQGDNRGDRHTGGHCASQSNRWTSASVGDKSLNSRRLKRTTRTWDHVRVFNVVTRRATR